MKKPPKKKVVCLECSRKFKGPQGLAAHLRHNHLPTIPQIAAKAKTNGAVHGLDAAAAVLQNKIGHAESDLLVNNAESPATHTPGPWHIEVPEDDLVRIPGLQKVRGMGPGYGNLCKIVEPLLIWAPVAGGFYHTIAQVDSDEIPDARLIAAAPELLHIARTAWHALESYAHGNVSPDLARECADELKREIDRAEGRDLKTKGRAQ